MAKVNSNRSTERRAVRAVTGLFEDHSHIVQAISGENDFGEDLYVRFVKDQVVTGTTIAVQVKGGASYKAAGGYRVPVGDHHKSWAGPNVPVFCIVQDSLSGELFWANATQQLRSARRAGRRLRSIVVPAAARLDDATIVDFVRETEEFMADASTVRNSLARMSGAHIDSSDYVAYFRNVHGEHLIFQQPMGRDSATLYHSDLDWSPKILTEQMVNPDHLVGALGAGTIAELAAKFGIEDPTEELTQKGVRSVRDLVEWLPAVGDVILDEHERQWVRTCFDASVWWREAPPLSD
jgi:hypothetical protein